MHRSPRRLKPTGPRRRTASAPPASVAWAGLRPPGGRRCEEETLGGLIPVDPLAFSVAAGAGICLALLLAVQRPGLVVRHARAVLALVLLVSVGAALALVRSDPLSLRLEIDPSTELLLPAGDPAQEVYARAVVDFGDDEIFVIAMQCDEVFTADNLAALRRASDRISRLPGVEGVKSLVKVTSFRWVESESWIEVRPFIEEIPTDPAELAELRRRALRDASYRGTLISADARTASLNVSFRKMSDRDFIASDLDGRIRRILDHETRDGRRFHVSGRPHIKTHVYHGMIADLLRLIPLAVGVVAVALALVFGTLRGVALPLGVALVSILWTFGAIALLAMPLTVLTVLLAPTLVAIGNVYGVHVLSRYEEEARSSADPRDAARRCLDHTLLPVLIAGLTTAVGFAALWVTDVPAVRDLGACSVLGVACITLLSLTAAPALLALLPLRSPDGPHGSRRRLALADRLNAWIHRGLARLARFSVNRSAAVLGSWALLAAVAAALVPRIEVDTDYLSFFSERSPVRREFEAVNRLLSGAVPIFVVFDGGGPGAFREPATLRAVEEIQRRLDALPGVSRTLSFNQMLKTLNRAVEAGDPAEERIPDTRAGVAELLFMIPKNDLRRFSTVDHARANLIVRSGEVGSAAIQALAKRIQGVLDDVEIPGGVRAAVTGNAILLSHSADEIARSQPRSVGLAALAIFALMWVGLRARRLGLVAMVPNGVPVLMFFGMLGAGVAPLSLPTSLIGCAALGIAIDDTTHYLVRYRAERAAGATPSEAALRCGQSVGRAIAITTFTLCLGFLSVVFSEFTTLREFGVLSAATMAICLAADLILLPALLVRFRV